MFVKLTFVYQPVTDLEAAITFHRDVLQWDEAWREGSDTVAFWMPERIAQVMLSRTDQAAGPMYLVDSVEEWLAAHPTVEVAVPAYETPGGSVVGVRGPNDNQFYVFDQPNA